MRAKLQLTQIKVTEFGDILTFKAVGADEFGPNGEDENNTFALYTPAADLQMTVTNPDLQGTYETGQEYYVDFTLVESPEEPPTE